MGEAAGTPGTRVKGHVGHIYRARDVFSIPKYHQFDPSHSSAAPTGKSEVRFRGCGSGWSTWYMWYTCTGTRGTPGDGLDGFSTPKNPQFDPSHPSVAPISQKLDSGGVAVGGAPGTLATCVQGHMKHLGMV